MKFKDILKENEPVLEIETRAYDENGEDFWFGYCTWDGKVLEGLEEDCYSLDEEILGYKWDDDDLICWVKVKYA